MARSATRFQTSVSLQQFLVLLAHEGFLLQNPLFKGLKGRWDRVMVPYFFGVGKDDAGGVSRRLECVIIVYSILAPIVF